MLGFALLAAQAGSASTWPCRGTSQCVRCHAGGSEERTQQFTRGFGESHECGRSAEEEQAWSAASCTTCPSLGENPRHDGEGETAARLSESSPECVRFDL